MEFGQDNGADNGEIVANATNSPNFCLSRSADVIVFFFYSFAGDYTGRPAVAMKEAVLRRSLMPMRCQWHVYSWINHFSESVTPRIGLLPCEENVSAVPMWKEVGCWSGREVMFDAISRDSVLVIVDLKFIGCRPWLYFWKCKPACVKDEINVPIALSAFRDKSNMLWTVTSICSGRQESYSWVPSAKDWSETECCRMSAVTAFVYKMNSMGPLSRHPETYMRRHPTLPSARNLKTFLFTNRSCVQ